MQTTLEREEAASAARRAMAPLGNGSYTGDLLETPEPFISKNPFAAPARVDGRALIEAMVNSKIYQDYEKAFSEATGMPVALLPTEDQAIPCPAGQRGTTVPVR